MTVDTFVGYEENERFSLYGLLQNNYSHLVALLIQVEF